MEEYGIYRGKTVVDDMLIKVAYEITSPSGAKWIKFRQVLGDGQLGPELMATAEKYVGISLKDDSTTAVGGAGKTEEESDDDCINRNVRQLLIDHPDWTKDKAVAEAYSLCKVDVETAVPDNDGDKD